jgi:hypothetical protein
MPHNAIGLFCLPFYLLKEKAGPMGAGFNVIK